VLKRRAKDRAKTFEDRAGVVHTGLCNIYGEIRERFPDEDGALLREPFLATIRILPIDGSEPAIMLHGTADWSPQLKEMLEHQLRGVVKIYKAAAVIEQVRWKHDLSSSQRATGQ
jgi:hypothetical protein